MMAECYETEVEIDEATVIMPEDEEAEVV